MSDDQQARPPGWEPGWQPPPGPPGPVRSPGGLGTATIVLAVALALVQVGSWATSWSASADLIRMAGSGTDVLSAPLFAYDLVNVAFLPAALAAYVVGCLWLQRCRTNAELVSPDWRHARSKVWVWLGWWVPVVSLWFPYQVVRDVRGGSLRSFSSGALGLWWTGWLLFLATSQVSGRLSPVSGVPNADLAAALPWVEGVSTVAVLVALVVWVRVVREVTAAQGRWAQPV